MGRYENNIRRNMEDLMNAVVMQAVEDYREAYLKLMRGENDQARKMLMKTEAFFQSEDFSCYTTVDGPRLLSRLRKEREEVEESGLQQPGKPFALRISRTRCFMKLSGTPAKRSGGSCKNCRVLQRIGLI